MNSQTKICGKCRAEKPTDEFTKDKRIKDGLSYYCAECKREIDRAYRACNREELNEKKRNYCKNNKEKVREWKKRDSIKNAERIKVWQKRYRKQYEIIHRGEITERKRKYRAANKERLAEYQKNRRQVTRMARNAYNKAYQRRHIDRLSDGYIKKQLIKDGLPKEAVTPQWIELKRLLIKNKRTIKNVANDHKN